MSIVNGYFIFIFVCVFVFVFVVGAVVADHVAVAVADVASIVGYMLLLLASLYGLLLADCAWASVLRHDFCTKINEA